MSINKTFGASLLIAGCSIGAGMLALPILSLASGFLPALLMLMAAAAYMVLTGFLLTEVLFKVDRTSNLLSLSERLFGRKMETALGLAYCMLFFSLLVAYLSASGSLFHEWLGISAGVSSTLLAIIFTAVLFTGMTGVDLANRLFFSALVLAYFWLLFAAFPHVDPAKWNHVHWAASFAALPALVISFGYHNLIPSLATYLDGSKRKVLLAIVYGNAITFTVYLLWQAALLGILDGNELQASDEFVSKALANSTTASIVVLSMRVFSFFSIATSFITISASFVDFLKDGFKKVPKIAIIPAVTGVPLALALLIPGIFYQVLHYAGGIGTVFVFGIFPAMAAFRVGVYRPLAFLAALLSAIIFILTVVAI